MNDLSQLLMLGAAVAAGFAGSGHCFVMCGGMAGAFGMRVRAAAQGTLGPVWAVLFNQTGRITGYALVGALVGALSQGAKNLLHFGAAERPLRSAAGLVTLLIA